ncbi:MAG: protein-disulfide reductase DsbD domain-containing protein [Gammaproteobacteria bacterium]
MKKTLFIIIIFATSFNLLAQGSLMFPQENNKILPADKAFGFKFIKDDDDIVATWSIKESYYLYLRSIKIKNKESEIGYTMLDGNPFDHEDEFFGDTVIIKNLFRISFKNIPNNSETQIFYQGCSDKGFCYPVQSIDIK